MSASKPHVLSRLSKLLESKSARKQNSNTLKKSALATRKSNGRDASHLSESCDGESNDSALRCGYYAPHPVPKSFVVGRVRKLSANGSPPLLASVPKTISKGTMRSQDAPIPALSNSDGTSGRTSSQFEQPDAWTEKLLVNGLHGSNGETDPHSTFNLLLGLQDSGSPYFTRCLVSLPYLAGAQGVFEAPDDSLYHVPELDPQAFALYKTYARTGGIDFNSFGHIQAEHVWIACWPLMNAVILGCAMEEIEFADKVMDTLLERLTVGIRPDVATVEQLFDKNKEGIPDTLRKLAVDRFIDAQKQSYDVLETSIYPAAFRDSALQTALSRLYCHHSATRVSDCKYHAHATTKTCYKTRCAATDTSKERRVAAARKASARDVRVTTANLLQNGVKSIDWEQRRADANEALRAKTANSWVGCRGLASEKTGNHNNSRERSLENGAGVRLLNHKAEHALMGDQKLLTNGTAPTCNPAAATKNSPDFKNAHLRAGFVSQTNNRAPFQASATSAELAGHYPHPLDVAELHGSSTIDKPSSSNLALRYKPSVDRLLRSESASAEVLNGSNHVEIHCHNLCDERRPRLDMKESTFGSERCLKWPGAYPESDFCSSGAESAENRL